MPRTIRFHLDESCDPRIAEGLRIHGVDVTTTIDVGLRTKSDLEHLEFAVTENRLLVTQDADFLRAAAAGAETSGIAFYADRTIGEVVRALLLIWEVYEIDEVRNRIEFL
jgi:uncharacterized protein with PIN domain